MGTLPTKYFFEDSQIIKNKENKELKEKIYKKDNSVLYTYIVKINSSTLEEIKKNTLYKIYLCENDVIIEHIDKIYSINIIYQDIQSWFYSKTTFGFNFSIQDNLHKLAFKIDDSSSIRNNIKEITSDLVLYYENL